MVTMFLELQALMKPLMRNGKCSLLRTSKGLLEVATQLLTIYSIVTKTNATDGNTSSI